jgi:outer membrane protein OmpA-like peptidoglycan-associated protein
LTTIIPFGSFVPMPLPRNARLALAVAAGTATLGACGMVRSSPPPMARPAAFTALGVSAPYLSGDVVGGIKARSARMAKAKIRPLPLAAQPAYMGELEGELRRQTAGMGLDVLRIGRGIVIRIPAAVTFDAGSAAVKPQFAATLREISRTVKGRDRTFVDVFAHSDLSGSEAVNQALSDKRAAAVAADLSKNGVAKARVASRGYGKSAPLYNPETSESEKAANRRVEIRLIPYG